MAARRRTATPPLAGDAEEATFLATYDASIYPRPSLTVDVVLLAVHEGGLVTLVLRRAAPPFKGRWALPGGFCGVDEGLEAAAERVLRDKCGLEGVFLEQLAAFGAPDRDPRTRVVTVAFCALVDEARFTLARAKAQAGSLEVKAASVRVAWPGDEGGTAELYDDGAPMPLAFDHDVILGAAVQRLRAKVDAAPVGAQLLPERFTLLDLQTVHEAVLARSLNKDSFRRRVLASGELVATGELEQGTRHRPAELYRFRRRAAV